MVVSSFVLLKLNSDLRQAGLNSVHTSLETKLQPPCPGPCGIELQKLGVLGLDWQKISGELKSPDCGICKPDPRLEENRRLPIEFLYKWRELRT